MIDEDPIASINIATTDLREVLNAKKNERFSLNSKIRNVWILKQYLVHMDDLKTKRRVYAARKRQKNERYPYHLK